MKRKDKIILTGGILILLSPIAFLSYLYASGTSPSNYDDINNFLTEIDYESVGSVASQRDWYSVFAPARVINYSNRNAGAVLRGRIQGLPGIKCNSDEVLTYQYGTVSIEVSTLKTSTSILLYGEPNIKVFAP